MVLYYYFLLFNMLTRVFSKNINIQSGIEDPTLNSVGLRLFTDISNNNNEDNLIEIFPEECCLESNDNKCNIIEIIGDVSEVVSAGNINNKINNKSLLGNVSFYPTASYTLDPGQCKAHSDIYITQEQCATTTITLVAPLLYPFERKGYCTVYIDSNPISAPKDIVRETVKIEFDTKLKMKPNFNRVKICNNIDEDPFNNCKPVNCDTYYNGKKSYYSTIKKRCVSIPTCLTNKSKIPKGGYNPVTNKCIDQSSIDKNDFEIVRQLSQSKKVRNTKDLIIIETEKLKSKNNTYSKIKNPVLDNFGEAYLANKKEMLKNKNVIAKNKELNCKTKPLKYDKHNMINQLDINKQDININKQITTTPNIEMTIPSCPSFNNFLTYLTTNKYATMILSGVILMQCLLICTIVYCMSRNCGCCKKRVTVKKIFNYRQDASVTTPLIGTSNIDTETTDFQYLSDSSNYVDKKIKCYKACQKERKNNMKLSMSDDILSKCINRRNWHRLPRSDTIPEANIYDENKNIELKVTHSEAKKPPEVKVNFQEECTSKIDKINKNNKQESVSIEGHQNESSEREIYSHSYDYSSNITGFKKSSTNFEDYNQRKPSTSIEKGAQAYFSNDSIDDFLSERGVVFFGDNNSKYSLTSLSSAAKSITSTRSSKTSKNNIVKNVMSLLSKKSKGPSSDPGVKQCKTDLDLELLHISTASAFTSSNDTDTGKDIKTTKDFTSSL